MSHTFDTLQQRTTPHSAYEALRAAILNGSLAQGEPLREARIAVDMGISRAPVREALGRLEEDGLIMKLPFRGAFVAEVGEETIAEIASLRMLIEPYAVELSLPHLDAEAREELQGIVAALREAAEADDIARSIDHHLAFHGFFYERANHALMQGLWNTWETRLRLFLVADHRSFTDLRDVGRDHEKLAKLILTKRPNMAKIRSELAAHIHGAPGESISALIEAPSDVVARLG